MAGNTYFENTGEILQDPRSTTSVKWNIPNYFSLPQKVDLCIESPPIILLDATWYLRIYPNGKTEFRSKGWIGLYIMKRHSISFDHCIDYTFTIKKKNGSFYKYWRNEQEFAGNGSAWGCTRFVPKEQLLNDKKKIISEDTLTIFCVLHAKQKDHIEASIQTTNVGKDECIQTVGEFSHETARKKDERKVISTNLKSLGYFLRNVENFFKEECLCDIIINIKGEQLRAHKLILAAHSPVFSAMFAHEMTENNSGIIEICDYEPNVFKEFLQYLYTRKTEVLSLENICEVYCLADKYDVKPLKNECIDIMIGSLTVDIFCDVISLAVQYDEPDLLRKTTDFFLKNVKSILFSTNWKTFMCRNPIVANELVLKSIRNTGECNSSSFFLC